MWGHATSCCCPLCHTLCRVCAIVSEGSKLPTFVQKAAGHVRVLEGELRDTLRDCQVAARPVAPPPPPQELPHPVGGPPTEPPATGPLAPAQREGPLLASQPDQGTESCLYPKSKPSEPAHPPKAAKPKVEPVSSPEPLVEVEDLDKPQSSRPSGSERKKPKRSPDVVDLEKAEKTKKKKDKRRTRSRSRRRERTRGEGRSPRSSRDRRRRSHRRPRSGSRDQSQRGRERKTHPERPPLPRSPLRPRTPPYPPGPRSPSRPPPGYHRPQGEGWRGPIPYSDHPRWTEGKNKGLTKRSKQEYHNRRY